jgi:hypothetical protein
VQIESCFGGAFGQPIEVGDVEPFTTRLCLRFVAKIPNEIHRRRLLLEPGDVLVLYAKSEGDLPALLFNRPPGDVLSIRRLKAAAFGTVSVTPSRRLKPGALALSRTKELEEPRYQSSPDAPISRAPRPSITRSRHRGRSPNMTADQRADLVEGTRRFRFAEAGEALLRTQKSSFSAVGTSEFLL